jgi:sugar/nucleoside kinase (ribokinase family)
MDRVRITGGDTMNFWIQRTPQELAETLRLVNVLLINDAEAKMLAGGEKSLPRAARKVLAMGPQALVIKHGEYGATIFFREGAFGIGSHPFRAPAMPLEEVKDPTGAGDSFAGGFMGYIASQGQLNREVLKRALFYGGVMGSFAVERFGTERLQKLTRQEIDARFQVFRELTHLE